ncbi:MAG: zinc ribbon domain-containing protein [bacterium]
MPYYDYVCGECGSAFEIQCGINDDRSGVRCAECGSGKVERNFGTIYLPKKGKARAGGGGFGSPPGGGSSCSTCTSGTCSTCG